MTSTRSRGRKRGSYHMPCAAIEPDLAVSGISPHRFSPRSVLSASSDTAFRSPIRCQHQRMCHSFIWSALPVVSASASGSLQFKVNTPIPSIDPTDASGLGRVVKRMLSRHEVATVQCELSTAYFASSSIFASLSLGTFLLRYPMRTWSVEAQNLVCPTRRRSTVKRAVFSRVRH